MASVAGTSWLLRTQVLLETADVVERQRVEQRWWRLRGLLGEKEFDHLCCRLSPADLRAAGGDVDELLRRLDDGWPSSLADASLFESS